MASSQALTNSLILSTIFEFLGPKYFLTLSHHGRYRPSSHLLQCILVNSTWYHSAIWILWEIVSIDALVPLRSSPDRLQVSSHSAVFVVTLVTPPIGASSGVAQAFCVSLTGLEGVLLNHLIYVSTDVVR